MSCGCKHPSDVSLSSFKLGGWGDAMRCDAINSGFDAASQRERGWMTLLLLLLLLHDGWKGPTYFSFLSVFT